MVEKRTLRRQGGGVKFGVTGIDRGGVGGGG